MADFDLGQAGKLVSVGGWRTVLSGARRLVGGAKMVEIVKKHRWGVFTALGILWMLTNIFAAFGGYTVTRQITPVPYGEVDIISAEYEDRGDGRFFYFAANFIKYGCDIEALRLAVKYPLTGVQTVDWEDVDGREDDEEIGLDNRVPGEQTLRLRAHVDPDFEWLEIRTTHLCPRRGAQDAQRVPMVFARLTGGVE